MKPRILLCLPQMPQDPASGAARTAQTAVEMALEGGFEVRALGTTATERGTEADPLAFLQTIGLPVQVKPASGKNRREFRFTQRGIPYTLLDTGRFGVTQWEAAHGRQFDALFDEELKSFSPDIVFTYGGLAGDQRRHKRAHLHHAAIAFCVFNLAYLNKRFFEHIDSVLTPSEFLAAHYRREIGLVSTPLPTPLDLDDVLAQERDPIFVTMVNPSIEKGLFFFVTLAEELCQRYPEIAVLAIESRGTAGMVVQAGLAGGFDLRRHEGMMIAGSVPRPRDIFANTRVLLVPSVWEEPSGRVVAEALVNGVPPLVSDRGGLAESCNGAGLALPLPADLTVQTRKPVPTAAVEPWIESIARLAFDDDYYEEAVARTRVAAQMYSREHLSKKYRDFFESALRPASRSAIEKTGPLS
jgi:glycosyltransferase involved in cell wall biosynthesis